MESKAGEEQRRKCNAVGREPNMRRKCKAFGQRDRKDDRRLGAAHEETARNEKRKERGSPKESGAPSSKPSGLQPGPETDETLVPRGRSV